MVKGFHQIMATSFLIVCRLHPILHRYTDILLQLHISCEKFQLSGKKFPFLLLEIWWWGGGDRTTVAETKCADPT